MAHVQYDHRRVGVKLSVAVAATVASLLSTAYADLGDQLFKLLADDGARGDNFGISVAISGAIALIRARDDDDNRTLHLIYFKGDVGKGDLSLCSA